MESKKELRIGIRAAVLMIVLMMTVMTASGCGGQSAEPDTSSPSGADQKTEQTADDTSKTDDPKEKAKTDAGKKEDSPDNGGDSGGEPAENGSGSGSDNGGSASSDIDDDDDDDDDDDGKAADVTDIGASRVKQIVLERIPGAKGSDIVEFEREVDGGHIEYEGTVRYDGKEYEFTIDGSTGNILEWEID